MYEAKDPRHDEPVRFQSVSALLIGVDGTRSRARLVAGRSLLVQGRLSGCVLVGAWVQGRLWVWAVPGGPVHGAHLHMCVLPACACGARQSHLFVWIL